MLAGFATRYGITYDLLSDEGSRVIEQLGLLNQHTKQQQTYWESGFAERHQRLPYPGTLVLDARGVVVERIFHQSFRDRPSAGALFREVSGVPAQPAVSARVEDPPVLVTAWLDSDTFRPLERSEVHVELRVAAGWHVYAASVPAGYTGLHAELEPVEGLTAWPAAAPAGRPLAVAGLPEELPVLEGVVTLHLPFRLSGAAFLADGHRRPDPGEPGPVELTVGVRYQACSDTECLPPVHHRLRLRVTERPRAMPS